VFHSVYVQDAGVLGCYAVQWVIYEGHPESKDHLAIKKNKQNKNLKKLNVTLLQTLSYFST
jgi:hypothetical protein